MYKVVIWGTAGEYNHYINCVKLHEITGEIKILGITSNESDISYIDSYKFIPKNEIKSIECDYCIVAIKNFRSALNEAFSLGIEPEKLIPIRVFSIPFFNFSKYIQVKSAKPSIISRTCWGGFCYNYLGLEFNSPFINMFFSAADFNKLMQKFDYYLSIPLKYETTSYHKGLEKEYPVGRLDDLLLHFLHYSDFEEAITCYNRRKTRINRQNLLFVSSTDSKSIEEEFDSLPQKHKIIFVPYKSSLQSSISIRSNDNRDIGEVSNLIAFGDYPLFDILSFVNGEEDFLRIS